MTLNEITITRSKADPSRFNLYLEYDNGHSSDQRLISKPQLKKELGEFLEIPLRQRLK